MAEDDDYQRPYRSLNEKLKSLAEAAPSLPPWYEGVTRLGPTSTEEDHLAVYKAVRLSGDLPEAASFFLVSYLIDQIAARDADEALGGYEARLAEMEWEYRLDEGGIWPAGTAPAGYEELRKQYVQAWNQFFVQKLRELGEPEMADLLEADQQRFDELTEAGRRFFMGPKSPEEITPLVWVRQLVEAVAGCMEADNAMGPLGYRYDEEDDLWPVMIYPKPVELIGGAVDGEVVSPGFWLDLEKLRGLFERVETFGWQSIGLPGEGPLVSIEGVYRGREVWVQVLAYAPEDEEPGMKLDTRPRRSRGRDR